VPARIDDLRVGQREVDQADVLEVVRHLVDEEGRIGLAVDARALQVALAELAQFAGVLAGEHVEVAGGARVLGQLPQAAGERDDLGQLHRALDLRMARQDLLDQRRAGARQAEHEDRVGAVRAVAFARRKKSGPSSCLARRTRVLVSSAL
jgi:hypothetical protein